METAFIRILNMGIAAGWLALAVMVLRLLFKKAPKATAVLLWALVGVRLICPFSPESVLSLIPSAETVPENIALSQTPAIQSGIPAVNAAVNPVLSGHLAPAVGDSVNPMQVITFAACVLWITGMAVMLFYTAFSYFRIHRKVREAVPFRDNVLLCDHIDTPFILGVFRPRIYLPSDMNEADRAYVIAHETAHLKRRDHWWKPLGFLLLTVYWFHPLLWISYRLLCKDIELACDEKVIRELGSEIKKPYSSALINCSVPRRMISACPLAFGEIGIRERVRSVLGYKKPAFWVIAVSVIVGIAVAVCFLTNPKKEVGTGAAQKQGGSAGSGDSSGFADSSSDLGRLKAEYPQFFAIPSGDGLKVYVWQMAQNHYRCWLISKSKDARTDQSFAFEGGVTVAEMRLILSTYDVDRKDIEIEPVRNPLSSYYYEIDDAYRKKVRNLFWGGENKNVTDITDRTETERISTDDALELFYSDGECDYYFPSIRSEYVVVRFSDGSEKTVKEALKSKEIGIADLDRFGIKYIKENRNAVSVIADGHEYPVSDQDARDLTRLLTALDYDRGVCKCLPDFSIELPGGEIYGVKLLAEENYARRGQRQAELDEKQADTLKKIAEKYVKDIFDDKPKEKEPSFKGTVLEVRENSILVQPDAGTDAAGSSDKVTVPLDAVSSVPVPTLKPGDRVLIVYNGEIAESFPAQINKVFAVYLLSDAGEIISPTPKK